MNTTTTKTNATVTLTSEEAKLIAYQLAEPCTNPSEEYIQKLNEIIAKLMK